MSDDLPTGTSGNNHRVTNAVLQNEMKHLRSEFDAFRAEWRDWCKGHDNKHQGADAERKAMDNRITRNEERLTFSNRLLGAVSVIGNVIAGTVGVIK